MKKFAFEPVFLLFFIIIAVLVGKNITGNTVKDESIIIYFPPVNDLPNDQNGRIVMEFGFPSDGFKVGEDQADYLLFFDSKTVPGLKVAYSQNEKRIFAGLPSMSTPIVEVLDGKQHKLEYIFNKEQEKQAIFLDDVLLNQTSYSGKKDSSMITAFAVYDTRYIESLLEINVKII